MTNSRMSLVKLGAFCGAGLICGVLTVNTLSVPVRGDTVTYRAQFTSVEGLNTGNPVTMNGVRIGRVADVRIGATGDGTSHADVALEISANHVLSAEVTAAVRYGDMLGARYVALSEPAGRVMPVATGQATDRLAAGDVIPLARTAPAVDLTALLNGFKPLFDALEPEQVNTLTRGFVETFSGQTQTLTTLLTQIGTMSTALANNDVVFTQLIDNLATLMRSMHTRQPQLEQMLAGLHRLTDTVLGDAGQLDLLLDEGHAALAELAGAVTGAGGAYADTITNLKAMLEGWQPHTDEFNRLLTNLPEFGDAVNRAGQYGGFVSLYLCNFTIKIARHEANIFGSRHSPVCR
ncbi:MlaD family protein [Mycolicibacterium thermoresistibile]